MKKARSGAVTGQDSERQAAGIALDICEKNGGEDCKVIFAFHNQCGAVAQKLEGGSIGYAAAYPQHDAESQATKKCGDEKSCRIVFSECTMAQQVQ